VQGRQPTLDALADLHEVHAVAGLDRTLPRPGLQTAERLDEGSAELLRDLARRRQLEVPLEEQRVPQLRGIDRAADDVQARQQLLRVARQLLAVLLRIEVDLVERVARLETKGIRVRPQVLLELRIRRLDQRGQVLGDELQLLPQAAADD